MSGGHGLLPGHSFPGSETPDLLTGQCDSAILDVSDYPRDLGSFLASWRHMNQFLNDDAADPTPADVPAVDAPLSEHRPLASVGPRAGQSLKPQLLGVEDELSAITSVPGSARPEAFRKPFASLPPQSYQDEQTPSTKMSLPRTPSWSSSRPATTSATAGVSVRPKNARTYCNRHGLAKNPQGQCLVCEREAKSADVSGWKGPFVLVLCAVALGALVAALV